MEKTNTAHLEWDRKWKTDEGRSAWLTPEEDVRKIIPLLKERKVWKVLDLGCGVGRHSLLLAKAGFNITAMDGSKNGINFLTREASLAGVVIDTTLSEMTTLSYDNTTFDYVLAWNVIYHGDLSVVTRVISEITRVLKPGGLFQWTMLSKRNDEIKTGIKIAHNTYINREMSDKNHPHFYCNFHELASLFTGYEFLSVKDCEHQRPGSYHWHLVAEKW
jgi:2-polyprenyl-3-methyl-5-hydroxy-6-metoxy-1,4-benzoquinol methylase